MKSLLLATLLFSGLLANSQCFTIQSILVDACDGGNEGKNEMVLFQVGNAPLSTSNLTVNWPSNGWLGVCQNAGTAADIASVNATITKCGFLKEPVAGILPARAKVLLVTSTAWNPMAQSFATLSDTLIVIFQCAGNTAGHFKNYATTTPLGRTLTMSFSAPASCSVSVTYSINLLTQQNGTPGAQDGGSVAFDPSGNASYFNNACQAPYIPLAVDAGPDQNICFNSQSVLTATANGVYNTLAWSGGTGTFSNPSALTTTYTPGAGESGQVKLYCSITRTCTASTSTAKDSVYINVIRFAQANLNASNGYSLCPGASSVFSYSLSNAAVAGTVTPAWSSPSASTPSYTVAAPSGTTAVTYTLNLNNLCGNTVKTFTVYPLALPTVSLSASTLTACAGSTVGITATGNSGNYVWSNPSGATTASVVIPANTSTTGIVTTTNSCGSANAAYTLNVIPVPTVSINPPSLGLCNGQSATLAASSNASGTFTWSTGAATSTISVNTAGVYTASLSNQCGSASASSTVTVGGSPNISIVPSASLICSGQTATLVISGSSGTYSWSTGSSASSITTNTPGIYTASVSNSCGSASASFSLTALSNPTVTISPTSTLVCNGQAVTLTAVSNAGNYIWNNSATTNTISVNTAGVKTVTVSNQCGTAFASINIMAGQTPSLSIAATSTLVCPNETVTLTVSGGSAPYQWSNTSNTGPVVSVGAGTYSVSSTNACGTGTASIVISQYTLNASFTANPQSGVKPLVVTFTNNSSSATAYNWSFGNGNASSAQNPGSQTYPDPGTYTVVLTTANGNCMASESLVITVLAENPYMIIPNVFTPNGDNINEVFHISAFNIKEFHCTVYDRWGLEMLAWDDLKSGWDGMVAGKNASDGTYFYIIQAKDIFDKEVKAKGAFLLVR